MHSIYIAREHTVLLLETLGKIGRGVEAHHVAHLIDLVLAGVEQESCLLETFGTYVVVGGEVERGLDFAVQTGTTHVHRLGKGVDVVFGIVEIGRDFMAETIEKLLFDL